MKKSIGAPLALLFLSAATSAYAQTAPASSAEAASSTVDEILVTARKREERLQDVPLTISVVNGEAIARANLVNVSDLAAQTPGFSFRQGFGRTGPGNGAGVRPSVRGMSSIVGAPNAAFFVDGVYVSDNISSYQLDNLERVEVIKGPQSALFGRGTFAGAISYVTRRPTNEVTGRVRVNVGQYDSREISGFISGPVVKDKLLVELNARHYEFGGDYINADSGKRDLGAQRSNNFGGRVLFTPVENLEIVGTLGYSNDHDKGYLYNFQGSALNNCFPAPLVTPQVGLFPRTTTNRRGFYCGEVKTLRSYAYNNDAIEALGYHGLDREFVRSSVSVNYETDNGFSLASITAFNTNKSTTGQDNTLLPSVAPAFLIEQVRNRDFSQELRLMSPQDKRVRGLVGLYYYKENRGEGFQVSNTNTNVRLIDYADGVRSRSVFAMVEGDITDSITLSAEGRYQKEKIIGSTGVLGAPGQPAPAPTAIRKATFDAFLPRVTARWQVNPDLTLHVSAAKGNKPGGFNSYPADISAADATFFNSQGFDLFDEETAWSYEIGAKGVVGGWINYSVAAFYTDWTKQQLSRGEAYTRLTNTPNSVVIIQNAGESEIKGFEFDLSGRPLDWLYVRAAYTYVDAKFTKFFDDTTQEIYDTDGRPAFLRGGVRNPLDVDSTDGGDVSGNRLPQTPEHQFVLTAEANRPLTDDIELTARADLSYESKRYSQVDNLNWAGDSYNLSGSLGLRRGNWDLSIYGRNLLQDRTPLVVTRLLDFNRLLTRVNPLTGANQTTFFRDFSVSAPRKRQIGVSASYKF
ncbi:TonB-dependent receptor [Phenylobacterium sp.]|jgi:outer membrane receptor protein involved in Fe transport|uniref:TonB-dependent receptor n=1 Tax=Phenylobacterium sp. TaxID=1871053 RepID=UPI0037C7C75B